MKSITKINQTKFTSILLVFTLLFTFNFLQAQDNDNDGIVDALDLDDDNDGILDIDESYNLNLDTCLFTQVSFRADSITFVGGLPGAPYQGDAYRFRNVAIVNSKAIDARITIISAEANITSFTIDDDAIGNPDAWQASFQVPANQAASMQFKVEYIDSETSEPIAIDRIGGIFYDIDHDQCLESITLNDPQFYAIEKATNLTLSSNTNGVTFQGSIFLPIELEVKERMIYTVGNTLHVFKMSNFVQKINLANC